MPSARGKAGKSKVFACAYKIHAVFAKKRQNRALCSLMQRRENYVNKENVSFRCEFSQGKNNRPACSGYSRSFLRWEAGWGRAAAFAPSSAGTWSSLEPKAQRQQAEKHSETTEGYMARGFGNR